MTTPGTTPLVPVPPRPGELVMLAAWFGLLAGLSETAIMAFRKFILHQFTLHNLDLLWMAPVAAIVMFLGLGVALAIGAKLWPRLVTWRLAVGIFGFLAVLAAILELNLVNRGATVILALGIGVQLGRLIGPRRDRVTRFARLSLPLLAVVAIGVTAVIWGRRLRESSSIAQGTASREGMPNVLLIVLDTVGALHLSLYGYDRPTTPHLEAWARGGVRFEHAFSMAPWTLTSHASMFTGRWPHELSADWLAALDDHYPTLAEELASQGYASAGFVANSYCGRGLGLNRGFAHYEDYPVTPAQILFSSSLGRLVVPNYETRLRLLLKSADDVNGELLGWLDRRKDQRPFFAFLNYMDAHDPYDPPAPFDTAFSDRASLRISRRIQHAADVGWTPAQVRAATEAYDGSLAYLDAKLGELFENLERRGLLANTLVIVTADHGEQFGEHGIFHHGNSLYHPLLHVPLVLSWPGHLPAGRVVATPVSLHDLAATVMDLADDRSGRLPGRSLAPHWADSTVMQPAVDSLLMEVNGTPRLPSGTPISRGSMKAVAVGGFKLIRNGDGVEELYDLATDPGELRDLVADPRAAERLAALRRALDAMASASSSSPGSR